MARTLSQLKERIETLIEQQGPDAPVAAFIFTNEDVMELDDQFEPQYFSIDFAEQVLNEVEENDWIYEQIGECIDDEIRFLKKSKNVSS